jgi:hypothetical protein
MLDPIPLLMTTHEAAEYLGVSVERVLTWTRDGRLPAAARAENGDILFRLHVLDDIGEMLVAFAPVKYDRRRRTTRSEDQAQPLQCGCNPARSAFHLCRTAAALNAALQLAEGLAAAMPSDPLLRKLSGLCRDALTRHLAGGQRPARPRDDDRKHVEELALPRPATGLASEHEVRSEIQA